VSRKQLRKLVQQYYDRLFRAARFMCNDPQAAEDLVQETFLAAAESLESFAGRSTAYTWLYGIMLNKFRRWLRHNRSNVMSLQALSEREEVEEAGPALAADYPAPPEVAEQQEAAERVRKALQSLSADHRSVVAMRFVEGMAYQEIAAVLGCPVGTVKSRIHYALKRIAHELDKAEHDSG